MISIRFVCVQLFALRVNQMDVPHEESKTINMSLRPNGELESDASSAWNDRVLIALVIATMLLSLAGYMHV
jgi:hypothetical protein